MQPACATPASASPAATVATRTKSFFMPTSRVGDDLVHRTARDGSLLDRLGELERLGARQVAFEPEQQRPAIPEEHRAGEIGPLVR